MCEDEQFFFKRVMEELRCSSRYDEDCFLEKCPFFE